MFFELWVPWKGTCTHRQRSLFGRLAAAAALQTDDDGVERNHDLDQREDEQHDVQRNSSCVLKSENAHRKLNMSCTRIVSK